MMMKINSVRFNTVINNFKECIENIEKDLTDYNNLDEEIIKRFPDIERLIETALRADIIDIFKIIEDYIALSLKVYGVGISNKTINEALDKCLEEKLINNEFRLMMRKNKSIRDSYSHKYNYPRTEDLINFYVSNKKIFEEHLNLMVEVMKKSNNESPL